MGHSSPEGVDDAVSVWPLGLVAGLLVPLMLVRTEGRLPFGIVCCGVGMEERQNAEADVFKSRESGRGPRKRWRHGGGVQGSNRGQYFGNAPSFLGMCGDLCDEA